MPAIITHDLFAKDVYNEIFESVGGTRDEAEAFLLGNQGPDPLLFVGADPRCLGFSKLGSTIHRTRPTEFIMALKEAVPSLPARERSRARAYVLGFLCHYELDRAVHPLVYSQVDALCGAGVEGLGDEARSEVHAVIEAELDELALTAKRGETVASFNPATAVLKGSRPMLDTVSRLYALAVKSAYGLDIPQNLFARAVGAERAAWRVLYSPGGAKRQALGALERLVRPHSLTAALSHRAEERTWTPFANAEHAPWRHPFTEAESRADFWDLYEGALESALASIAAIDRDDFSAADAARLTGDLNFYGEPVVALVVAVEDAQGAASAEGTAGAKTDAGADATAAGPSQVR